MQKNWLHHYPKEIPHHIDPDQYTSLLDVFEESIAKFGDKVAFTNIGACLLYTSPSPRDRTRSRMPSSA